MDYVWIQIINRNRFMKKVLIFLTAFVLFAINMSGQEGYRRKRVAVVLSGGGAKGMPISEC